jgi:hypothetical protein
MEVREPPCGGRRRSGAVGSAEATSDVEGDDWMRMVKVKVRVMRWINDRAIG